MAINKNHEFEELDGVKCAIVEKNLSQERVDFLKDILEYNGYVVVVAKSAPPKKAPAIDTAVPETPAAELYSVGVTDLSFNSINAVFGRILKAKNGHVVTWDFWRQEAQRSNDNIPYYRRIR